MGNAATAATAKQKKVLVVEDDAAFAYAVWRHLESHGFSVHSTNSSMEALDRFDNDDFDCVIADVRLLKGEPHGIALARMIKRRKPKVPVILVTAYPDLLKGEEPLPGQVLTKPVELSAVRSAVETCIAS